MIQLTSPAIFNKIFDKFMWPLLIIAFVVIGTGLYFALYASPIDYQQGEMVRVMYIHVPSAWMALGIYVLIGIASFVSIVWKIRIAYFIAIAAAPVGATFAAITLITGALWGKPIWGAWWVWDARLTSMLVLFLLYLAYIAVVNAGDDIYRSERPAGIVALLGLINVPIVKFSVDIWNSLHQPASILRKGGVAIEASMLAPLLIMFIGFGLFFIAILMLRTKTILIKQKGR
jgi:heme exporter protein C